MRPFLYRSLFACALFAAAFSPSLKAQTAGSRLGCRDAVVRQQAEEIKQHYLSQGFELLRDAMITMNSQEPFPVTIQLNRGSLYQIVFVANKDAQRLKMEVYNSADELLGERTGLKDQPNYLIYTFSPERTDMYFLSIMQRLKSKEGLCGSLFILRLAKEQATVVPYSGGRPAGGVE